MRWTVLFTALFLFTACTQGQLELEDPLQDRFAGIEEVQKEEKTVGVLALSELTVGSKATHVLLDEEGEELMKLKSTQVVLNPFLGEKVEIEGKLEEIQGVEVLEVSAIDIFTEESQEVVEEEVQWESYSDRESRFSFSYPNVWELLLANKVIYLEEGTERIVKFTRLDNRNNLSLEVFVRGESQDVTVNGQVAKKVLKETGFDLYFSGIEEVMKVSFTPNTDEEVAGKQEELFFQFLQTFEISDAIVELQKCGGTENLLCPAGFRCELDRGTIGVCVDIDAPVQNYRRPGTEATPEPVVIEQEDEQQVEEVSSFDDITVLDGDPYSNKYMEYSLIYPKHWWYKSFGAQDNSLWHTEFSEKEIENMGDGIIMVDVKHGARGNVVETQGDKVVVLYPRDDTSHYQLTGPKDLENELKSMAVSIKSQ